MENSGVERHLFKLEESKLEEFLEVNDIEFP